MDIGDQTDERRAFVYNGALNLIARGVAPTEKNILEESAKIAKANRLHFEAQQDRQRTRDASKATA